MSTIAPAATRAPAPIQMPSSWPLSPPVRGRPSASTIDVLAANAFAWGPMVCDYTRYAKNKSSSSVGTLIGSLAGAAGFMFVGKTH